MEQASNQTPAVSTCPLVDGHTHIDQYQSSEILDVLTRAEEANVGLIIAAGTTIASCRKIIDLSNAHPIIYAGVGLHPSDLSGPIDEKTEAELRLMANHPRVIEWSETGLDYQPTSPAWADQHQAFRKQIRMAREYGLPLVIHSREADDDMLRILREENASEVGGAWHYFQGSASLAAQAIDLNLMISFGKPLLRMESIQKAALDIPLDRIVIETDSYPQYFKKHRERWTEPWHLPLVAMKLAELLDTDAEHIARITTDNYLRMLMGRVNFDDLPLSLQHD